MRKHLPEVLGLVISLAAVGYSVLWWYYPESSPASLPARPTPPLAVVSRSALGPPVLGSDRPGESRILLSTFVGGASFLCTRDSSVDLVAAHVRNLDRYPGTIAFALYETKSRRLVAATRPGGLPPGYEGWAALPLKAHLKKGQRYLLVASAPGGGMVFCSGQPGGNGFRAGCKWTELWPPHLEPAPTEDALPAIFCAQQPRQAAVRSGADVPAAASPRDDAQPG